MGMKLKKIMPTSYFLILLALSAAVHFLLPSVTVIEAPVSYAGALLIIAGIVLNIQADMAFKRNSTTVKPHIMPSKLVISGAFRISRHPMYLGMFLVLLGESVILGSLLTFIFPFVFAALMECIFIGDEERNLEKAFGKDYAAYRKKVRRWI